MSSVTAGMRGRDGPQINPAGNRNCPLLDLRTPAAPGIFVEGLEIDRRGDTVTIVATERVGPCFVVTIAPEDPVVPPTGVDHVGALPGLDEIATGPRPDHVVSIPAEGPVVTFPAPDGIVAPAAE